MSMGILKPRERDVKKAVGQDAVSPKLWEDNVHEYQTEVTYLHLCNTDDQESIPVNHTHYYIPYNSKDYT